jgi:Secretion system C-terminal sorting domain
MKKLLLLLLFCLTAKNYAQDVQWEKTFGGQHADYLMDAIPTADYGFILAGSSLSDKTGNKDDNNKGDLDYWVWKMKENGTFDWQKSFGGSGADFLHSIDNTTDGGFILGGTSGSPGPTEDNSTDFDKLAVCRGGDDIWVIKLNAAGGQEWQQTIGGIGQEKLKSIKQTKDGGYVLGGSSSSSTSRSYSERGEQSKSDKTSNSFGGMDYWIIKLDKNGKIEWQNAFGGKYEDELRSIEQTTDGGYIIGGYSNSPISGNKTQDNKGTGDYWIIKIDKDGKEQWQKTIGGDGDDQLSVVHQCFDGNYIIGGNSSPTPFLPEVEEAKNSFNHKTVDNNDGTDFWVLKLATDGAIIWQETYNFGKEDVMTSITENKDHSLLISGFAKSEKTVSSQKIKKNKDQAGINDYIVLKINPNGEEIWNKTVDSGGEDILKKTIETRDGGYLLAGTNSLNNNDFYIVKLKDRSKQEVVKSMIEALPNPTTTFTNVIIGYEYSNGTASVFDLAGRQLQSFAITSQTIPIDLTVLPEGIYIVNVETDKGKDGIKVIKVRK